MDDFENGGEETSDIFGDVKHEEHEELEIDRDLGDNASIFGNAGSKKTKPVETAQVSNVSSLASNAAASSSKVSSSASKVPSPASNANDKFAAALARSGAAHKEAVDQAVPKPSAQPGKHTIKPKVTVKPTDVTVQEAIKNASTDLAQRQSNARQARQAEVRQAAPAAVRRQAERRQAEQRQAASRTEKRQSEPRMERRQAAPRTERRQQLRDRPAPNRPFKKKVDLGYKVTGELETCRPGGSVGFFKRHLVGVLNSVKCVSIERKFKNAREFKCKPFRFKIVDGEAMIVSYSGNSRVLEFPAFVIAKSGERIPVCYIHSNCLYNNFLDNYRTKNAIDNLTSPEASFGLHDDNRIIEIKLPEGLKAIFDGSFDNCTDISSLTIPSTVQFIGNKAFRGSTITKLFFNGPPVSNWSIDLFPGMQVYVKEEYAEMY